MGNNIFLYDENINCNSTLIVIPQDEKDIKFHSTLLKKPGYGEMVLYDNEKEEMGLLKAMLEEKKDDYVPEDEIHKALGKKWSLFAKSHFNAPDLYQHPFSIKSIIPNIPYLIPKKCIFTLIWIKIITIHQNYCFYGRVNPD